MTRTAIIRLTTAAALSAMLGVLLMLTTSHRSGSASASSLNPQASKAAAVAFTRRQMRLQRASFKLLRRAPAGGDSVPADVASTYLKGFTAYGASLADARGVSTPFGPGWVIPVPSAGQVCLVVPDSASGYGIACQTTAEAAAGHLAATFVPPPDRQDGRSELVALVPDGAPAPTATQASGDSSTLATSGDGVAARTLANRATVQLHSPSGAAVERLPVGPEPQGRLTKDCGNGRIIEVTKPTPDVCRR